MLPSGDRNQSVSRIGAIESVIHSVKFSKGLMKK